MNPKVCPACRRPARNRPLPPEGFWQVQVLQRLGMYPYRCEACDARFYRKVPVGKGLGKGQYGVARRGPLPRRRVETQNSPPVASRGPDPSSRPPSGEVRKRVDPPLRSEPAAAKPALPGKEKIPRIVAPPEATGNSLSHTDFVHLIDQLSRSEQRKGLKEPQKEDEDA